MQIEKPGCKIGQSLDKVTLTLHEAKDIVGLLGVIYTMLISEKNMSSARETMLDSIDKMRFILVKAKLVGGIDG